MTQQETPVLRYDRLYRSVQPAEDHAQETARLSRTNEALTWGILSVCLAGWAVVGLFLWIPRVLRAVLAFSVALIHATLTETDAQAAGRRLRSAANFYRRGFVSAVRSIRFHERRSEGEGEERSQGSVQLGPIVREAAWAIVTWYAVAWTAGLVQGTSFDLAAVPWWDLWSEGVEAVFSIPQILRR